MEYKNFIIAQKNNAVNLNKYLKTGDLGYLSSIVFWEGMQAKDLSADQIAHKIHDIIGCCSIGAIPSMLKTGADGYTYIDNEIHEIESKMTSIESKYIHLGSRDGLYWSSDPCNSNNRATIKSRLQGRFDSKMTKETLLSKKRHTVLISFDCDHNQVIDAWIMDPEVVLTEITKRKERTVGVSLTLKLSSFLKNGKRITPMVDYFGWEHWEKYQIFLSKKYNRYMLNFY